MAPKGNDQAAPHRPRPARDVTPSSTRSNALAGSPKTARRASLNGSKSFGGRLRPPVSWSGLTVRLGLSELAGESASASVRRGALLRRTSAPTEIRAVLHSAASDSWTRSRATMEKQTGSSRPEAVALDDQGHSGPPGPRRLLRQDARPSPTPRPTQGRRWRPPAPCHEESCPRSLRRSRDRRLHRSRPGCGGHHRVPRR